MKTYRVGGFVRDAMLGIPSKDLDLVVEGETYESMLATIEAMAENVYERKPEFVTVRANVAALGGPVDFVLCRKDGQYSDGRRPDSVEVGTLFDDLARRDFTMNAIAIDTDTDRIIDPHGGIVDINDKIIRCVGSTFDRFNEDALRMLRAIRFTITKGFTTTVEIDAALRNPTLIERLETVTTDRMRVEIHKAFAANTLATLDILERFKGIRDVVFADSRGIWIKPTVEKDRRTRLDAKG